MLFCPWDAGQARHMILLSYIICIDYDGKGKADSLSLSTCRHFVNADAIRAATCGLTLSTLSSASAKKRYPLPSLA